MSVRSNRSFDTDTQRHCAAKYFVEQYQTMLEENLDEYIEHFAKYMKTGDGT